MLLLLSLYLALLAFFILLASVSSPDPLRVGAAVGSIRDAFAKPRPETPPVALPVGPATALAEGPGTRWAALLPLSLGEVSSDGERFDLIFPASSLFVDGDAALLPGREDLVKAVAATVTGAPDRFTVTVSAPPGDALDRTRQATLAARLIAAGLPATDMAVRQSDLPGPLMRLSFVRVTGTRP